MGDRSYEDALQIFATRQRIKRPGAAEPHERSGPKASAASGTPDLRGTPSIVGMSEWLQSLGHTADDINALKIIHVAGTKGKGSTCAFTESLLAAYGRRTGFPRKTGLYTSPHLVLPEERIRINFQPLSQAAFAKYFFEIYDHLPQLAAAFDPSNEPVKRGPRYLQLYALLAFHTFIRENVDVAIIETHSGGEYDATNVIRTPVVTAVTTLGLDHIDMLGPTIENIAWHKGGIYKPGAAALSALQDLAPAEVLQRRAKEGGETVHFIGIDDRLLSSDAPQLKPVVQRQNASLAVAVAETFIRHTATSGTNALSDEDIGLGIKQSAWPGRFQIVPEGQHTWYLDAAHNEMSVEIAAQWFVEVATPDDLPRVLIFAHINELRDAVSLLQRLATALKRFEANISDVVFTTYNEGSQKNDPAGTSDWEVFSESWRRIDPHARIWHEPIVQNAIQRARTIGSNGMSTLITGSQHLVGPALRVLNWDPRNFRRASFST